MQPVRFIAAALCLALSSVAAASASELFDNCAASAATPWEAGYEGVGPASLGHYYALDAIDACVLALEDDPDNAQVMAWLGNAYAANGEPARAVPLLEPAAAAGNPLALTRLGDLLILGKGTGQDKSRGFALLEEAVAQDYVPAFLTLGYSYAFGDGVAPDPDRAFELYLRAAEAGLLRAQLLVAEHYRTGPQPDEALAFDWIRRAAESGDGEANALLGIAYLEGRGTPASPDDALAALQVSSDAYNPRGATVLGYMTELGIGLDADPDAAEQLYYTGETGRFPPALYNIARLREQDAPDRSRERYETAARAGEWRAAVNLALMLIEGRGGPQDLAGAVEWTRRAASAGNLAGINNLGRMYELGLGVTADLEEARRLYGEAAALGYALAAENLERLAN